MSSNSVHPQNSIENASDSKKIQESRTKEKEELLARKKAFEERLFGRTGMVENRQLMKRKDFNQLYEKLINEHKRRCPYAGPNHFCGFSDGNHYLSFNFHSRPVMHRGMKQVVVEDRLFSLLFACHRITGHGDLEKMHYELGIWYNGVTKWAIKVFLGTCKGCPLKSRPQNEVEKQLKSRRPIVAWRKYSSLLEGQNGDSVVKQKTKLGRPRKKPGSDGPITSTSSQNYGYVPATGDVDYYGKFLDVINQNVLANQTGEEEECLGQKKEDHFNLNTYSDMKKEFMDYCEGEKASS